MVALFRPRKAEMLWDHWSQLKRKKMLNSSANANESLLRLQFTIISSMYFPLVKFLDFEELVITFQAVFEKFSDFQRFFSIISTAFSIKGLCSLYYFSVGIFI